MIRAWRNELLLVAAIALATIVVGFLVGEVWLSLVLVPIGYMIWFLINFVALQFWVGHGKRFRPPISFGVWETVFDGLQRREQHHRKRRRQLIASVSDLRDAVAVLPDALVLVNHSGGVIWFNPIARRLLGLHWPHDKGTDITAVLAHPVLKDDLASADPSRPLEILSPANGAWMLSIQITAPFGNQHQRLLVARDITSVFRLEQSRRDFLTSVSHELRTPLTVFRGYLETLESEASSHPLWQKPIAHMDQQARRMQSLVDDLLALLRLEMTDRPQAETEIPVHAMLETIFFEAKALSGERGHDLQLSADPTVWLLADEAELYSAFSNLVFNAVHHTPPQTRVEIRWQGDPSGAVLSVQDQGPGVAAYHQPRLAERFYRVEAGRSRRSGGSGLGLAIVKQILERYSAELRIDSKVGSGTTFSCHFPQSIIKPEAIGLESETP